MISSLTQTNMMIAINTLNSARDRALDVPSDN